MALPALGGDSIAHLSERRRNASRMFEEALLRAEQERQRANTQYTMQSSQMQRDFKGASSDLLQQLGGYGVARSPRMAGRPIRDMRDQLGHGLGQLGAQRAELLAMIEQMANQAQRHHSTELAGIDADAARLGVDFSRLLPGL